MSLHLTVTADKLTIIESMSKERSNERCSYWGIALLFQSPRLVATVAELGSLGRQHDAGLPP